MEILNVAGENVQACAQFDYKGWTVSFSTIFKGACVLVFQGNTDYEVDSVEKAIKLIDKLTTTVVG